MGARLLELDEPGFSNIFVKHVRSPPRRHFTRLKLCLPAQM